MNESTIVLEQALYGGQDAGGYRFLARSAGFLEAWLPEAERLCTGFGDRPAGVACAACVFAQPLGKHHVAIVQVADRGSDDAGRPGTLGFHLVVLGRADYKDLGGDPFRIAERFPPSWQARGPLPALALPAELLATPTVEQVQRVLQRSDGPTLLGGTQVLVNGGRLVFQRPTPDTDLLRCLWTLLPTRMRGEMWPASFAFGNALGFHVVVLPRAAGEECTGYVREEAAGDYPEGRYELDLQIAAEAGDQEELDALFADPRPRELRALFAGRSKAMVWLLGLIGLALFLVLPLLYPLLMTPPPPPAALEPDLLAADQYPALNGPERERLTTALEELAKNLSLQPPAGASAEKLLEAIDQHLGTPNARRDPGTLAEQGPLTRQVRLLLWKHEVAGYNDPRLNPVELLERLGKKVGKPASPRKEAP